MGNVINSIPEKNDGEFLSIWKNSSVNSCKPQKIIEITVFSKIHSVNYPAFDSDLYFFSSWAGLFARRIKKVFNELDVECWRADIAVTSEQERVLFGVKGILFPYKFPIIKNVLTLNMLRKILYLQKHYNLTIHYNSPFDLFAIISPYLFRNSKIILSHLGGNPPDMNSLKGRVKYWLFKISYPKIHAITYVRSHVKKYLTKLKKENVVFLPVGADFEQMRPKNKIEARRRLGLDQDKIYGLYVGKFFRLKGVDKIIEGFRRFSTKYNFSVILVGGSNDRKNDLYEEVASSGCVVFGPQPYEWGIMADFYSAADFYFHPAFNRDFGGLDVSWMEALACNIPVLSPQLAELDTGCAGMGVAIIDEDDLYSNLEWMIKNYPQFRNCRKIAQKYLDGNHAFAIKLKKIIDGDYINCAHKELA